MNELQERRSPDRALCSARPSPRCPSCPSPLGNGLPFRRGERRRRAPAAWASEIVLARIGPLQERGLGRARRDPPVPCLGCPARLVAACRGARRAHLGSSPSPALTPFGHRRAGCDHEPSLPPAEARTTIANAGESVPLSTSHLASPCLCVFAHASTHARWPGCHADRIPSRRRGPLGTLEKSR